LNMAYNVLTGGTCPEDIERLHQDATCTQSLRGGPDSRSA
jgi:hypothetical protein